MAGEKITFYASEEMIRLLESWGQKFDSKSAAINAAAIRYEKLCLSAMPAFKENEWLLIMDALNGFDTRDIDKVIKTLHWSVGDALELERTEGKWGLADVSGFFEEVKRLPAAAKIAIIYIAEQFWSKNMETKKTYREALLSFGAKINE